MFNNASVGPGYVMNISDGCIRNRLSSLDSTWSCFSSISIGKLLVNSSNNQLLTRSPSMIVALIRDESHWLQERAGQAMRYGSYAWGHLLGHMVAPRNVSANVGWAVRWQPTAKENLSKVLSSAIIWCRTLALAGTMVAEGFNLRQPCRPSCHEWHWCPLCTELPY